MQLGEEGQRTHFVARQSKLKSRFSNEPDAFTGQESSRLLLLEPQVKTAAGI